MLCRLICFLQLQNENTKVGKMDTTKVGKMDIVI